MKSIDYEWNLRKLMSDVDMYATTALRRELKERGVNLSASQVYRLVTEKPERLNLHVLVALTDIFNCTADDLVRPIVTQPQVAETGSAETAASSEFLRIEHLRPKRARIVPDDEA